MPPFMYSARHVAEALKVSIRDHYRWIEEGKLPAYKDGNEWYIRAEDYDDFLFKTKNQDGD